MLSSLSSQGGGEHLLFALEPYGFIQACDGRLQLEPAIAHDGYSPLSRLITSSCSELRPASRQIEILSDLASLLRCCPFLQGFSWSEAPARLPLHTTGWPWNAFEAVRNPSVWLQGGLWQLTAGRQNCAESLASEHRCSTVLVRKQQVRVIRRPRKKSSIIPRKTSAGPYMMACHIHVRSLCKATACGNVGIGTFHPL